MRCNGGRQTMANAGVARWGDGYEWAYGHMDLPVSRRALLSCVLLRWPFADGQRGARGVSSSMAFANTKSTRRVYWSWINWGVAVVMCVCHNHHLSHINTFIGFFAQFECNLMPRIASTKGDSAHPNALGYYRINPVWMANACIHSIFITLIKIYAVGNDAVLNLSSCLVEIIQYVRTKQIIWKERQGIQQSCERGNWWFFSTSHIT